MKSHSLCRILIALVALLLPALVLAQTTSMSGGSGGDDSLKYLGYMAAAYSVIWGAALLYFISLSKKEKEIWTELQELKESLKQEAVTKE
jgi:hypothetical protein